MRNLKQKNSDSETEEKPRASSDNICKMLAEKYPEQFIEWLFGIKVNKVKVLKTEFTREPIRADAIINFESNNQIFHIEFQTTAKSHLPLPLRMLDYYVALKRKFYEKRIRQVLIILHDTGETVPDKYEDEGWFFPYQVVKMWEEDADELMKSESLLAFAILCGEKKQSGHLLKKVAKKIEEIKDREKRQDVLRITQAFAGLRYNQKVIYELLRGMDMLEESVIVQDWIQVGMKKGLEQGLEQGKQEGEVSLILRMLTKRFGKLSAKTTTQIESLSIKQLEKLGVALLDFKNKTELNEWLNKHNSQNKNER